MIDWNVPHFRASLERGNLRPELRDGLLKLCDAVTAAHHATTDQDGSLASAVEHSSLCAIWVELDDIGSPLAKLGTCDCGLDALIDALSIFTFDQEGTPDGAL